MIMDAWGMAEGASEPDMKEEAERIDSVQVPPAATPGLLFPEKGIYSHTQTTKRIRLTYVPFHSRCSPLASTDHVLAKATEGIHVAKSQGHTSNLTQLTLYPSGKVLLPWHPGLHTQLFGSLCSFLCLGQASGCYRNPRHSS